MSHDPALQQVVLEALERIRQVALRGAPQAARFLTYIVEETLAGRGAQLKEYTVAVGALGRPSTFDPSSDAAVRVAARQLRFKLADYYGGAGAADPVVIELPKGTYVPSFTPRVPPSASSPDPGGTTPDEERRPARAPDDRPAASRPSPWSRRAGVAAALLLGIAITAMALWPRTDASGSTAPVVVVLPFANLTGRPDEEFISDGLADEIATAMARSPATRVIARASAWKFKGAKVDIREVGRQLGAGYVIEGSVLRSDTRYRVSVHVSAATDGVRVWSEQYEVERPEVFGLYDTIAAAVHEAVAARVNPSLGALAVRRAPSR